MPRLIHYSSQASQDHCWKQAHQIAAINTRSIRTNCHFFPSNMSHKSNGRTSDHTGNLYVLHTTNSSGHRTETIGRTPRIHGHESFGTRVAGCIIFIAHGAPRMCYCSGQAYRSSNVVQRSPVFFNLPAETGLLQGNHA